MSSILSAAQPVDTFTPASQGKEGEKLKEVFGQFVGETFFGQMMKSMRQTVGKPAYFHGGRAEEVFQGQLDQKLVEEVAKASDEKLTQPMFELFQLQRQ
jgi:hypothetical protein